MANDRSFNPDYYLPPGDILEEILEENSMSQAEFAKRAGLSTKHVNEIIKGKAGLTPDTSLQFEKVLGIPASFWINFESQYREALAREKEKIELEKALSWLDEIPYRKMVTYGWIERFNDKIKQLDQLMHFFRVATPADFNKVWAGYLVKFRMSVASSVNKGAVAAWLRMGEMQAEEVVCEPFNKVAFKDALNELRHLTLYGPDRFVKELQSKCAHCGVVVVFVRELPKTGIFGATRWISKDKALIQLSLRYKTSDQMWFSFYHEAAHVLFHSKRNFYLENDDVLGKHGDEEENKANSFAQNLLIPQEPYKVFIRERDYSDECVQRFAKSINIHPGIVVGRLQHDKLLSFSQLYGLKMRLEWREDD